MKRTILDRTIGYFSPTTEFKRVKSRFALERAYEAAQYFNTSDWTNANRSSANSEVRVAQSITRDRARDLTRNSAYANKALNVIVSNTIGPGIVPKIKGRNQTQEKMLAQKWKEWGETTLCDRDGKHNFYSMQAAVLRCIVESGENITKKIIENGTAKLQLLEPDYINGQFNNNVDNVQGLWIDSNDKIVAYELYTAHPGDWRAYSLKSVKVPVDQIIHSYKIERIGQLRGMPWAYPVANTLKDLADYQSSTLIRQKIASCFTAFVTSTDEDKLADQVALTAQRQLENNLEPATIRYLAPGQTINFANPPGVDQYDPFMRQSLRSVAAGFGVSYESLTGDYSQVNFSSGRMGHLEMQRNIDMWRWQMLIPQFCEPAFAWFLQSLAMQGMPVDGVTVQWTAPAREMIDPTKEVASLKDEVRNGFKSLPEAIRERGMDPDAVFEEIAETNAKLDELKIVLDTDPRIMSAQGMSQPPPPSDKAEPTDNGVNTSGQ
jgi:lambda family phage portal protein